MSMKYEEACWTWSVGFFKSNEMSNGHLSDAGFNIPTKFGSVEI